MSGNHIESEFTLELSEGLLLRPAAGAEVPQRLRREREIGGDGGVLEVAVVGRKQIELVILGALVMNPLAVDHHPQIELPRLSLSRVSKPLTSESTGVHCCWAATRALIPVHLQKG